MRILITNDDGFDAPGLAALFQAVQPLGDVTVVAPSTCHSSKGHAVETREPIRVERRQTAPFGDFVVAHCSPADCIRVGVCHVVAQKPDLVVTGINPGANLGVDLFYSGTAAAAREAAMFGIPAISVSQYFTSTFEVDWSSVSDLVGRIIPILLSRKETDHAGMHWNLNLPASADGQYPDKITLMPQGVLPHAVSFRAESVSGNSELLHYEAVFQRRGHDADDVEGVFAGHITATPVGLNMTLPQAGTRFSPDSLLIPDVAN